MLAPRINFISSLVALQGFAPFGGSSNKMGFVVSGLKANIVVDADIFFRGLEDKRKCGTFTKLSNYLKVNVYLHK